MKPQTDSVDKPGTPSIDTALSDALAQYDSEREAYKMIEGEFKVDKDKVDEILDKAKGDLFELLPTARDMAEALMLGAQSEAIKWQVTKYILDFCLKGGESEDDIGRLISSLKKPTKKPDSLPSLQKLPSKPDA